ncbi:NUDIX domain-containing protein [Micromonospora sp. WMMD1082]|uniref:NUDIX hydrolase n=1 Tax=Micromonospora sp. WMMD1082 TaxID=3016104 RepID=UPI002415CC6F|nr:NUDIX domain-containing protein [Micromonospora sp. WMMD1082]MDG4794879.1 NUDIX domain-containing protein [Micromonospora sp. WMMD1082]
MNEQDFLAAYDPRAYPAVAVTVDVVALTIRDGALHLLLIRRGEQPYAGHWALPGGFVRPDEDLTVAARRELAEETGLAGERLRRVHVEQLASFGAPDRDPRMRIVSVAHLAFAPDLPDATAGTDADEAAWVPVAELANRQLAFDHGHIVADGLERARSKLEYTPLATRFLAPEFTIGELRAVYETVWGHQLHAGNFHRKVLSVPGFVESTGASTERGGTRGGPRARLYRAGDARLLHPALLRPAREETVR